MREGRKAVVWREGQRLSWRPG